MAKILSIFFLCLVWLPAVFAQDGETARKQELEKLKKQAAQKQEELQKYREQEQAISKEITDLEHRKAETQRQKNKLQSDINYVEQTILSTEDKRVALERSIPMWGGVLRSEIGQYYLTPSCDICPQKGRLEEEMLAERALLYKAQFTVALKKENLAAKQKIYDFEKRNKKLMAQSSQIQQKQQVITTDFLKKQKDLNATKKKTEAIRKEIEELNKSARALDDLLARFEQQRKEAARRQAQKEKEAAQKAGSKTSKTASSIAKIDVARHSLPWPVSGKVISKFGKEFRPDLNTYIFRDGIKIESRSGTAVKAVAAGDVIYAGPFRSYGNVVIVDHGKGFFSIYGFLQQITVSVGAKLSQGSSLGTVGRDTQASSGTGSYAVYFETRQGTTAVDPLDWLKIQ